MQRGGKGIRTTGTGGCARGRRFKKQRLINLNPIREREKGKGRWVSVRPVTGEATRGGRYDTRGDQLGRRNQRRRDFKLM